MAFWGGHWCHLGSHWRSLGLMLDSHFDYLGSHWRSLGLMLAHILTLRGILGVPRTPRTLLWLTFVSILTYPLLGEMYSFSMYYVIIVLLRMCFLCIMSLLFLHVVCLIYSLCIFVGITCSLSGNYVHYVHPGLWCQEPQSATAPTPLLLN